MDTYAYYTRFLDNGKQVTSDAKIGATTISQTWTPTTPGIHTITAHEFGGPGWEKSVVVTVGTGLNLGSACLGI